ncbi:MAG: cyclic nucleotide-binding domain-containing protein [Candidatus Amulumruptor caecigallinarius]|nr:cyclic nucleotide-binding domain-containing protein [Candidatus Amulumruptor caecigallinarius]
MSLPLFKGVSHDAISSFLEKTYLSFRSFNPGEIIMESDVTCNMITCLLSGRVSVKHALLNKSLVLTESVEKGICIGFENLFGLDNSSAREVTAISKCGIMQFSKTQYMKMLQTNQIYLMNCLNFLSYRAQGAERWFGNIGKIDVLTMLAFIIDVYTSRYAEDITLSISDRVGFELPGIPHDIMEAELNRLDKLGIVEIMSDHTIAISSRMAIIEAARM